MLNTSEFGSELKKRGFDFYSGVPCSFLKDLINYAINESTYIMAANEGDAVAICAGVYLGGRKSAVLMQNSGLGNAVSPLTSLNCIFKIPVLGFISLRGEPGTTDEPQHELMGTITSDLLDTMKLDWEYLADTIEEAKIQINKASQLIENGRSFFFIVRNNTFSKVELKPAAKKEKITPAIFNNNLPDKISSRIEALEAIQKHKNRHTVFLATTGKTGRELYELADLPNNLYMVGSMGCVSPMGLGLALTQTQKNIIIIDGDGSLLMRMGVMPTIGYYRPGNLLHILLDNNCYDSTGGQTTVSDNVDFIKIAEACGYDFVYLAHDINDLDSAIEKWEKAGKAGFIYLKICKGSKSSLGRPKIKPFEVKERLMRFIKDGSSN